MATSDMSTTLGFGLGLRPAHYEGVLNGTPAIDWFEAITENYLVPGGKPIDNLARVRERWPLVLHGVSLSIGSTAPLDFDYLRAVRDLARRFEPRWISDHLCWTGTDGLNLHDLLPLPYTDEAIRHVARRVSEVQDFLGQRILLENVSSYVNFATSQLTEWEFVTHVCGESDCLLLLDVNNVYVSSINHGFDPISYLDGVPIERVRQFHLAGHHDHGTHIIDTHDAPIVDPVWQLYEHALHRFGPVATLIERDDNIPPLADLLAELDQARRIAANTLDAAA